MKLNSPIRLFVDAHVFDGKFQGTRTYIRELYRLLAQKEDLQIYLGAYDTDELRKQFQPADNIVFIPYRSRSPFIRLSVDIPRIIKNYDIRFAHFQYIVPLRKTCREIVTIHDVLYNDYPGEFSFFYRTLKQLLFGRSASRCEIVTTVSVYSKKAIQKYLHTAPDRVQVVPNGVSGKFFAPYDQKAVREWLFKKYGIGNFILYVSRIEPRKNHLALLEAFLDLRLFEKGYTLVLLGYESIPVPDFDRLLDSLPENIRNSIFINADLPDDDLLNFYRGASLFVYPSKAEGFGIPPLEAGAAKAPVICSNSSAMSDFSFFGENHIDPLNTGLLKQKMLQLLQYPPDEQSLNNISGVIRREYDWNASAEKLYSLILNNNQ
jgi:glycosyltransferase involved in cell wall biosynthesis